MAAVSLWGHGPGGDSEGAGEGGNEGGEGNPPSPPAHTPPPHRPSPAPRPASLDDQVAHAAAFLRLFHAGDGPSGASSPAPPPLAVAGHSIGAHIGLRAVRDLEEGGDVEQETPGPAARASARQKPVFPPVASFVALMPYMAFDPSSPQQRALRVLAKAHAPVGALAAAASRLPAPALRGATRLAAGRLAPHAGAAVVQLLACGGAGQALFLAGTEFRDLAGPADWGLLARLGRRAAVFAAPDDHWCPEHALAAARAAAPAAAAALLDGQRHDFPVCLASSAAAAASVAAALRGHDVGCADGGG